MWAYSQTMQSIHDFVLTHLQATKGDWPQIAREAGVSYRTLKKIATEEIVNPRVDNLQRLADYFRKTEPVS